MSYSWEDVEVLEKAFEVLYPFLYSHTFYVELESMKNNPEIEDVVLVFTSGNAWQKKEIKLSMGELFSLEDYDIKVHVRDVFDLIAGKEYEVNEFGYWEERF